MWNFVCLRSEKANLDFKNYFVTFAHLLYFDLNN